MNSFQLGILEKVADQVFNTKIRTDARKAADMRTTDVFVPSDDDSNKQPAPQTAPTPYDPAKQFKESLQTELLHALFQKSRR